MRAHLATIVAAASVLLAAMTPAAHAQNRALGRPTASSGEYSAISTADRAVDGNTNGNYFAGFTFHSLQGAGGWWYVDLGASYAVSAIDFWNRTDCCSARIVGATLGIFDAAPYGAGSPAPVWSAVIPTGDAHQTFLPGPGGVGRYVGIVAPIRGDAWLQIAELEVFGSPAVAAVPEPTSAALLAAGLLAVVGAGGVRRTARRSPRREG